MHLHGLRQQNHQHNCAEKRVPILQHMQLRKPLHLFIVHNHHYRRHRRRRRRRRHNLICLIVSRHALSSPNMINLLLP